MKRSGYVVAAIAALAFSIGPARAEETSVVMTSTLSPEELWRKVGDFCGIQSWHPIVQKCELSGDGRLRTLTVTGDDTLTQAVQNWTGKNAPPRKLGALAVDALERWDEAGRCYGYTLVYGEAPIADYHSTLCVIADSKGSALKWSGRYAIKPGVTAAAAKKFLDDVYTGGAKVLTAK